MNKKSMPGYKDGGSAAKSRGGPKSNNCGLFGRVQGKMNGGAMQPMGGRQNLANEETNRPNFGRDTTNFQYRNATPPGFANGGSMGQDDVLREMIMENLQKPQIQQQALSQVAGQQGLSQNAALDRLMKFNSA